jgi:spore photoproduct lyase
MMKVKRIFLSKNSKIKPLADELINRFKPEEVIEVNDVKEANSYLNEFPDPFFEGKQSIWLGNFLGKFFEACPCTKEYFRCGYWILSPVVGCPLDCSYCILQGYLNAYPVQVYLNLEGLFQEVEDFEKAHPHMRVRLGTGELADSLALEPELGYAKLLIDFFKERKNFTFELKTKTDSIEPILEFKPCENIVISWSVNPKQAVEKEERGSAGIEKRIQAANRLSSLGWRVGFHFDPILPEYGLDAYLALVEDIFKNVVSEKIAWISVGMLRFPRHLKNIIKMRHPESRILCGEMFPGKDQKLRYLRLIREKFYKKIINRIRDYGSGVIIYLCMEPEFLWRKFDMLKPE